LGIDPHLRRAAGRRPEELLEGLVAVREATFRLAGADDSLERGVTASAIIIDPSQDISISV